ncbi:hypothetical protein ABZZ44_31275 [Streptomyces sp. NPDC006460]|uniref:hypothetical protein n=1 Tax=Streptomyces sp. NPDC006460 TaxID=3154304 RepID=UPI0033AB5A0E
MSSVEDKAAGTSPAGRRAAVVVAVLLAVAGAVVVSFALLADRWLSGSAASEKECCWAAGATPAWTSERLGLPIPAGAADRRAGYKSGERYDTGLLSFTLPTREATAYLAPLTPKGTRLIRNTEPRGADFSRADGFAHLGLPEPETLVEGLLHGDACPGAATVPDDADPADIDPGRCAEVYAHEVTPGTTRLYLRSTFESGRTPPPAVPTTAP